jgi:shikimate 5-dehydrogenase
MAKNLKELIEQGIVHIAKMPPMNDIDISEIDKLAGYTVPLLKHDYTAKTALMWNTLYKKLGLNLRNIMVVADPVNLPEIFSAFKSDPKYMGGGAGVGLKEEVIRHLDEIHPDDLKSVNIIVKDDGLLKGYNTDSSGLYRILEEELAKENKKILGGRFIILGGGGVAKDFASILAKNNPERIIIINRTGEKAVAIAHELNSLYGKSIAYGADEHMIRGYSMNTEAPPDAIINVSEKGSDNLPTTNAFAASGPDNNTKSLSLLRDLVYLNPNVVIIDIVNAMKRSITLRFADSAEDKVKKVKFSHLINGDPMVIYQGVPAYKLVEKANKGKHPATLQEPEILDTMRTAVNTYDFN